MSVFGSINTTPVMEKYVGNQRKEFEVIEREMKKIIQQIKKDFSPLSDRITKGDISVNLNMGELNDSPSNKLIEKMFKKIFGVKEFVLTWITDGTSNAFTLPKSYQILDRNYKTDNKGHRTNNSLFVGVFMYTGLVTYADLDEKELIAIILHEIGHNFYPSVFNILSNISITLPQLSDPSLMSKIGNQLIGLGISDVFSLNRLITYGMSKVPSFMTKQYPFMNKVYATGKDIFDNYASLIPIKPQYLLAAFKGAYKFVTKPFSILFLYNEEKHADSFADDYGYSQAGATGLEKLRLAENSMRTKVYYNTPGVNWLMDLVDVQWEFISRPFNGYPSEQNRIRTSLDRLKRNAKDPSIDPRTKKVLEKEIKAYEDYYYNDYLSISSDKNKKRIFTWMYMNTIENVFGGKADIREILHAIDPHKYK